MTPKARGCAVMTRHKAEKDRGEISDPRSRRVKFDKPKRSMDGGRIRVPFSLLLGRPLHPVEDVTAALGAPHLAAAGIDATVPAHHPIGSQRHDDIRSTAPAAVVRAG